jgi:hypothetical protein
MSFCKGDSSKTHLTDDVEWINRGDSVVKKTFDTLRNTLKQAISTKGVAGAVQFCNTEALRLTAIYSGSSIRIKRISEKTRNAANTPDSLEKSFLASFNALTASNAKPTIFREENGTIHYFKPIFMQALCLHCHGNPGQQIQTETWQKIQELYPNDQATGYSDSSFRGLWHVTFLADKNKNSNN